jgi:hypothetical protein
MKPVDIKGRPIFSRVFNILQKHGKKLVELGWNESTTKPNLFFKGFYDVTVFADMRGTEIISIWDEPYPYLYASERFEDWKRRRAINKAVEELDRVNIPHRFSFYDECEPDGLFFGERYELADGKCKRCGTEFDGDGLFCSEKCEKETRQLEEAKQEEYEAEERRQRKTRKHNTDSSHLTPKKTRKGTSTVKTSKSGKTQVKIGQTHLDGFEAPSEAFKKRKARRDYAMHSRY